MTIPAGAQRNWCPACGDTCDEHGCRICTVCGTELQYPRVAGPRPQQQPTFQLSAQDLLGIPDYLRSSQRLQQQLSSSREQAHDGTSTTTTSTGTADASGRDRDTSDITREILQRVQIVESALQNFQELTDPHSQEVQQQREELREIAVRLEQRQQQLLQRQNRYLRQTQQALEDTLGTFTRVEEIMTVARQLLQRAVMLQNGGLAAAADGGGAGGGSASRPTSSLYLSRIPRVVLEPKSSILYHGSIKIWTKKSPGSLSSTAPCLEFRAIPGEFGVINASTAVVLEDCRVVIASPRTGKGGVLSEKTRRQIHNSTNVDDDDDNNIGRDQEKAKQNSTSSSCVVYFDRGGDVTFVQKALLAQNAGAQAVVIGNNLAEPWPYTMKDSKSEATKYGLHIPVVMVKQADAKAILSQATCDHNNDDCDLRCRLEIQPNPSECVVCLQTLEVGHTVLSLPSCGHVFHEACAMMWLDSHNTCPYCRRELPTDDQEYEQERRRAQRTHAGSTTSTATGGGPNGSGTNAGDFYG